MKYDSVKDSGERQQFSTGAVRDNADNKPAYELVSPIALRRIAKHLANGAKKYSKHNWERGMSMERMMGSALRHLNQWREGDRSEDHLAAACFNIMGVIHFEEMVARGLLPKELDDIPTYLPPGKTLDQVLAEEFGDEKQPEKARA